MHAFSLAIQLNNCLRGMISYSYFLANNAPRDLIIAHKIYTSYPLGQNSVTTPCNNLIQYLPYQQNLKTIPYC